MTETEPKQPSYILIAPLYAEYHLLPDGHAHDRVLGGSLAYAAAATQAWTRDRIGLVSRVGEDFPLDWLDRIAAAGFDTRGIRVLPGVQPTAAFFGYDDWEHRSDVEPRVRYARLGLPLPRALLDYQSPFLRMEDADYAPDLALRPVDLPPAFHPAHSAYVGPCHAFSQILLTVALREAGVGTILVAPAGRLLHPDCLRTLGLIIRGTDIVFTSQTRIRAMFREPVSENRPGAEWIAQMGAKLVLIQRGLEGIDLYDSLSHKYWRLPAYPATPSDITGMDSAFCGGFLAGWRDTYDPVEAALRGLVSVSLSIEGSGAEYLMNRAPALAEARLSSLRNYLPDRSITS